MMKFVITPRGANVWADGKAFTIPSSHPRWAVLNLGFKLKNEPLVSWLLGEAERHLVDAAAIDPRFRVTSGWLAWDNDIHSMTPQFLPTVWVPVVNQWVSGDYDLGLLARFLERSSPSQWELVSMVVNTDFVLNWAGDFRADAEKQPDGTFRLGQGSPYWFNPGSLSAPAGYVIGVPVTEVTPRPVFEGQGPVLDSLAGSASYRTEAWTGKIWKELPEASSFIAALDAAQSAVPDYAKVRLLAKANGVEAVLWAERNPAKGFQVTLQEGIAPKLGKETLLATTYVLPEAQAITRHLEIPGIARIKRDGAVLVELTN